MREINWNGCDSYHELHRPNNYKSLHKKWNDKNDENIMQDVLYIIKTENI